LHQSRHDRPLLVQEPSTPPTFGDPAGAASLLDCDNLDFVTMHLYGLTDPLSDKQAGKRGHIGDRSAAGIRLVLANDPERLAAIIVAQDRDLGAENTTTAMSAGSACGTALATRASRAANSRDLALGVDCRLKAAGTLIRVSAGSRAFPSQRFFADTRFLRVMLIEMRSVFAF
jgi:hypothetical protein